MKTLIAIGGVLIVVGAFFIAGITGLLFRLWPTSFPDSELQVSPEVVEQLKQLRSEMKFHADSQNHYPGATNKRTRLVAEEGVNLAIDRILVGLPKTPRESFVLATFKHYLRGFEPFDTEEQEQVMRYFNRILRILGVEGSNQLLTVWRYGFPYGWILNDAE